MRSEEMVWLKNKILREKMPDMQERNTAREII